MAESRAWVCVRLATYENKKEGAFLESVFTGRSGMLENTTFALLAPDGKKRLGRAGRGPAHLLGERGGPGYVPPAGSAGKLVELLEKSGKRYRPRAALAALPVGLDFRRTLNVAACDGQPLVVVYARDAATRSKLEQALAALAWSEAYVGRFQYALVSDRKTLSEVKGLPQGEGVCVVQPGRFGLDGVGIASAKAGANRAGLVRMLDQALEAFEAPEKDESHIRQGRRAGVKWESEIPVTDPGPGRGRKGSGR